MKKAFEIWFQTVMVDDYPEGMRYTDFREMFYAGYRAALKAERAGRRG